LGNLQYSRLRSLRDVMDVCVHSEMRSSGGGRDQIHLASVNMEAYAQTNFHRRIGGSNTLISAETRSNTSHLLCDKCHSKLLRAERFNIR
jgi:hypothetical protein